MGGILITGRGTSGSWQCRAVQLGAALGATVKRDATTEDIEAHDQIIVVKRARPDLLHRLRDRPFIYDVVDAWPQPLGNDWRRAEAMTWLEDHLARMGARAVVAATRQMATDCGPGAFPLPHHARPDIARNPIRDRIRVVGYEGSAAHLGRWSKFLELECSRRGWTFRMNPDRLADLDVVVALRDARGYPVRAWKSNVKLANAQGSGTPCVLSPEAGYQETGCGSELWAETQMDVVQAFDRLEPVETRRAVSAALLAAAPRLEDVARAYAGWLSEQR